MSQTFLEQRRRPIGNTFLNSLPDAVADCADVKDQLAVSNHFLPTLLRRHNSIGGFIPYALACTQKGCKSKDVSRCDKTVKNDGNGPGAREHRQEVSGTLCAPTEVPQQVQDVGRAQCEYLPRKPMETVQHDQAYACTSVTTILLAPLTSSLGGHGQHGDDGRVEDADSCDSTTCSEAESREPNKDGTLPIDASYFLTKSPDTDMCSHPTLQLPQHHYVTARCAKVAERTPRQHRRPTAQGKHRGSARTTLMVRNLPPCVRQEDFMRDLDCSGFKDTYDLFYVPRSFETNQNKGYAFINFTSEGFAQKFINEWHRSSCLGEAVTSQSIAYAAVQGREENLTLWSGNRFKRIRNPLLKPWVLEN